MVDTIEVHGVKIFLALLPAYGRKYGEEDVEKAKQDYLDGKDFRLALTGQYCSCRDFPDKTVSIKTEAGYVEVKK